MGYIAILWHVGAACVKEIQGFRFMGQSTCKRVLFLLPSMAAGGAERVLIQLANGTDRSAFDPFFTCVCSPFTLAGCLDETVPLSILNCRTTLRALWPIYRKIRDVQPDIVVSTLPHMNFASLMLSLFFPKVKFVVREAITPSYLLDKYGAAGILIRVLFKTLYPRADLILSPSRKILEELSEITPDRNGVFTVLPNPVDVKALREGTPFDETTGSKTIRFVACGRLVLQKGFDRLLEVCAGLHLLQDWRLDILGDGPDKQALEQQIEETGLAGKVFLKGHVERPSDYFARADCFLLPSRYEGLPNVALESLACGTPVIASCDAGGIAEIKAEASEGAVFIADDMGLFKTAMEKIVSAGKQNAAPSLLPDIYKKENVLARFNALLKTL